MGLFRPSNKELLSRIEALERKSTAPERERLLKEYIGAGGTRAWVVAGSREGFLLVTTWDYVTTEEFTLSVLNPQRIKYLEDEIRKHELAKLATYNDCRVPRPLPAENKETK